MPPYIKLFGGSAFFGWFKMRITWAASYDLSTVQGLSWTTSGN